MTKGTQLWPGDTMRAFFRAHIRRETQLDDAAAEKLTSALTKAVNRMMVWETPPDAAPAISSSSGAKSKTGQLVDASAFDPYKFSVVVVLAKTGRDGLLKRLAEIKTADNLRALAEAQHLAVASNLKKTDELRKAIVSATEQRLADRKAAAS
jgi:hypothetical protein